MKIKLSRHELYSHFLKQELELNENLIDDVLQWAKQNSTTWSSHVTEYADFSEALEKYLENYSIDDPEEELKRGNGECYPGGDGHDWNHIEMGDPTKAEIKMIEKAIKRFNKSVRVD